MSLQYDLFILTLQPDISKSVNDYGTFQYNITLNEYQLAGILLMAFNIFGKYYSNHIGLQLSTYEGLYIFTPFDFISDYLISSNNSIIPYDPYKMYWYDYINHLTYNYGNNTHIPNNIYKKYTCRFKNDKFNISIIYQFEDQDFIQGALSLCYWLDLNWDEYIDNIHLGNEPIDIIF